MVIATNTTWAGFYPGNVDGNETIDLGDVITGLQTLVNATTSSVSHEADLNGNDKIGIEELIYAMRVTAGLPVTLEQSKLENLTNFAALALADDEKDIESLEQMAAIMSYIGLNSARQKKRSSDQDIALNLLNTAFPCGTVEKESETSEAVVFTFTEAGSENCGGITGTVKVTPSLDESNVSYAIECRDVIKGDCVINGHTTATLSSENDPVTATLDLDNIMICNQTFEETVTMTYDTAGQVLSVNGASENIYSIGNSGAIVTTDFAYSQTDGMSGSTTIDFGTQTFTCGFSHIKTDPASGLPVSGSLNVNNTELNFSGLSSENPSLSVTLNDSIFNLDLQDVQNVYHSWFGQSSESQCRTRAALRTADGCTTLLNDLKQGAIAEMEEKLDENLRYAMECRKYEPPVYWDMDGDHAVAVAGDVNADASLSLYDLLAEESFPSDEGATEYSETNTQVAGVDEADFIKNDGSYIYILADGKFHIVAAWPPESSSVISSFDIEGQPKKMFVHNKRAFIYSSLNYIRQNDYGYYPDYYGGRDNECTYGYNCEFTGDGRKLKITVLDISDTTAPKLVRELYFSGSYLNSRRIGDAVHSVVIFPDPQFDGIEYWPEGLEEYCRGGGYYWDYYYWEDDYYYGVPEYTEEELTEMFEALKQENKAIILGSDITDWLPSVKDIRYVDGQPQEEKGLLGNCDDFYVSMQQDGKNFLSMVSANINGEGELNATTIMGKPGAVYASSSAFYICSGHQHAPRIIWFFDEREEIKEASTVHKFTLINDPPSSAYKGSGVVKGRVLNQFAMDEYEGFFRMATTTGREPNPNVHSTISVFEDKGTELEVVGQIDNIAPTEDIRSARFDRDRGYIVTFKKTDPLFVFNLSDPNNLTIAGELKIPGFSTYIHPMDDNHLLSIGYDSAESDSGSFAWFQGIMLQIFDVADMTNPQLTHKEVIGTRGSTSDAATNHLAFNFFKPRDLLAIPMVICEGGSGGGSYGDTMTFSGLMVYKVTTDTGFEYLGGVSHEDPQTQEEEGYYWRSPCANWWTNSNSKVKRSVFMDDYVFSVTEDEIRVNLVSNLGTDIAVINFTEP